MVIAQLGITGNRFYARHTDHHTNPAVTLIIYCYISDYVNNYTERMLFGRNQDQGAFFCTEAMVLAKNSNIAIPLIIPPHIRPSSQPA